MNAQRLQDGADRKSVFADKPVQRIQPWYVALDVGQKLGIGFLVRCKHREDPKPPVATPLVLGGVHYRGRTDHGAALAERHRRRGLVPAEVAQVLGAQEGGVQLDLLGAAKP